MNKKMTLRILSTAAALGMLTSATAFAENVPLIKLEPAAPVSAPAAEIEPAMPISTLLQTGNITINGLPVPANTMTEKGLIMIPVRAIAEALGYEVGWEEEANRVTLTRGAQYITMTLDQDAYTFSRMAPVTLGSAPVLVNDSTTYVPVTFLSEILGAEYTADGDKLDVIQMSPVTVKTVDLDENTISVEDDALGEVIVRLTEDTVITNAGKSAAKEDIKADSLIHILYSPAMTMSLPPQTTAVKIEVNPNAPVDADKENNDINSEETVAFEGTIKEVMSKDEILVEIKGSDTVLILSDNTNIHHRINRMRYTAEDLKEGMKISGQISQAMTRSLPPQTAVFEIVISD